MKIEKYISKLYIPNSNTHKGQNGKLLLIGGSELFHAASKWSLDVASKFVDMVFYSSVESNNKLIQKVKSEFWNGIVVKRKSMRDYLQEADCVLIGPGMERDSKTENLVNMVIEDYPDKKMVIDAGALQMVNPNLLNVNHIITPHTKEMRRLNKRFQELGLNISDLKSTIVLKGEVDLVTWFIDGVKQEESITGGNAGMTKGGTGDVLAGLIAALYCKNNAITSAVVGSFINKKAADELHITVGPFFNSSDLVEQVPKTLWQYIKPN